MIPDSHRPLPGIAPILFSIGRFHLTSYAAFMFLGVLTAIAWYLYQSRKASSGTNPHSWTILLSALLFGSLGAKLLAVAIHAGKYETFGFIQFLYSGRSIIGGLIGGWIGVKIAKHWFGIGTRHGNAIAPAAALGIAIGRLGCFLASCCYGVPTTAAIGVDFGDGHPRHPTQLYEAIYAFALFVWLTARNCSPQPPGLLFRQFLIAYLGFRFAIEFIRVEPHLAAGLSIFQILALAMIAVVLVSLARSRRSVQTSPQHKAEL